MVDTKLCSINIMMRIKGNTLRCSKIINGSPMKEEFLIMFSLDAMNV